MKKLITFCTFALLLGFAAQTFAADIVIKQVKIKKRNVSSKSGKDGCDNKFDIDEMTLSTITDVGKTTYAFEFPLDTKKGSVATAITMDITLTDCLLKSYTKTITCKLSSKGVYEGSYTATTTKDCGQTLTAVEITVSNECGETTAFEADLAKKEKGKEKDPCKEEYKLKEVTFLTDNVSGFYVMNFSFAFKKDETPDAVSMRVLLTDCKGSTIILVIKLGYDAATGQYVGGQAIPQNKDCPWVLTYGEVYGSNPCGEETTWAIDFGTVKTDGAGTRSTASSTQSGRPKLK